VVSADDLRKRLHLVPDPEVPALSVLDLGIVRGLRMMPDGCEVDLSPTYTGCPATEVIERDVREALEELVGKGNVRIKTVLDPPWTSDWISEEGLRKLESYGIAPPPKRSGDKRSLLGISTPLNCPRCKSSHTERIAAFGSTACKALHRCLDCQEPFEAFKCI
jgi:ring-1,2-phenylacetyl-CoA epoxidase subunit PaaD